MSVFEKKPVLKNTLDDTVPLTAFIEAAQKQDDYVVSLYVWKRVKSLLSVATQIVLQPMLKCCHLALFLDFYFFIRKKGITVLLLLLLFYLYNVLSLKPSAKVHVYFPEDTQRCFRIFRGALLIT